MYSPSAPVLLASLVLPNAILGQWCHFWSENDCEKRSGGVNYNVDNPGIFQNGGPWFTCDTADEFSLLSFPPGETPTSDSTPNHCHVFPEYPVGESTDCQHLRDLGFTPGDGGYYKLSKDKTCPTTSDKREDKEGKPQKRVPSAEVRNANYLSFYDDPGCEERSGGVDYSSTNQGCFQNGGPYIDFHGDDKDWHLEQYSTSGDEQCSKKMWNCQRIGDIDPEAGDGIHCIHLDDWGFHTGYGSYKIGRGGCPEY